MPNEPLASQKEAQERYTPNDISAPADETAAEGNAPQIDFSAYYRRDGSASEGDGSEPAFAPPIKLDFSGYDRVIDTHVKNLRKKLEDDPAEPQLIRTVWGKGYRIE